jgi:hypothetical protein
MSKFILSEASHLELKLKFLCGDELSSVFTTTAIFAVVRRMALEAC